jgi:hypothetical protein
MAVLPELKCALCGAAVDWLKQFFRASGAFVPAGDSLESFVNAPMHWECYANWPERPRFARLHVEAWVRANRRNPFWWLVHLDDRVYISVNPEPPVVEASVRLLDVGSDIRVPLLRWRDWLAHPESVSALQPVERNHLLSLLPQLRKLYPDDHAVVHAIDPAEKRPRTERSARVR